MRRRDFWLFAGVFCLVWWTYVFAADTEMTVRTDLGGGRTKWETVTVKGTPSSLIPRYIYGAELTYVDANTVTVGSSAVDTECRSSDNDYTISYSGSKTLDLSSSGAGGLDTGTEAADTWYAVFVIADTTEAATPNVMASVSQSSPTLPGTYDEFRRIGWLRNDASSNIRRFIQRKEATTRRRYWWDVNEGNLRALTDGQATTFATVDFSSFVPPTGKTVPALFWFSNGATGAATDELSVRPVGFTSDPPPWSMRLESVSASDGTVFFDLPLSTSQTAEYKVTDGTKNKASITAMGFNDEL